MAFFCQPCIDVMTHNSGSNTCSVGPCECCLKQSTCWDIKKYEWSEKNTRINREAVDAAKRKAPEKKTQYEKAVVATDEKKKSVRQPRRGMDCYAFQAQDAITGETLGYIGFKSNGEVMLLTPVMIRQKQVITDKVPAEVANFFQHAISRLEEEREVDRLNSIMSDG